MELGDLASVLIGFVLTLLIFSFVFRDNPLYRLAVHLLVGASAGYATVLVMREVILPVMNTILADPANPSNMLWLVPLGLGALLVLKLFARTAAAGNVAMAVLVAVGAAVGLVGVVTGTLFPQIFARYGDDLSRGLIGLVAGLLTICTLFYFHFTGRLTAEGKVILPAWQQYVGLAGQVVITITLAALFAGALGTSIVLLTERVSFFVTPLLEIFGL